MKSPFNDFLPTEQEKSTAIEDKFSFENSFLDFSQKKDVNHAYPNTEPHLYGHENNGGHTDREPFYELENYPQQEEELSDVEIASAVTLNTSYMMTLGWVKYMDKIIELLKSKVNIDSKWLFPPYDLGVRYKVFAQAIDKYQQIKGLKPDYKGVVGIGTWSALQDDLGMLNYDKSIQIDIEKAIKANQKYNKELWGKYLKNILSFFKSKGYTADVLPLDGKYFALIVAKWQSDDADIRRLQKDIDGILGGYSWDILRTEIEKIDPAYKIEAHIKSLDTKKAAEKYVELSRMKSSMLIQKLDHVKEILKSENAYANEKSMSDREGFYYSLQSSLAIMGAIPLPQTKLFSLAVKSAIATSLIAPVQSYFDEKIKTANLKNELSFLDMIEKAKSDTWFNLDAETVEHDLQDTLLSIRRKYGSNSNEDKKEFAKFTDYLVELELMLNDPDKVLQAVIASLIKSLATRTRIYVDADNSQIPIEDWDGDNIDEVAGRNKVKIEFTRWHPKTNMDPSFFVSEFRSKLLKQLWDIWKNKGYSLRDLGLERDVFFKVNSFGIYPVRTMFTRPQPWYIYIKTLNAGESIWRIATDIAGRDDKNIFFDYKGKRITKGNNEKNNNGRTYNEIILTIVNRVMQHEFNASANNKNTEYIQSEANVEMNNDTVESLTNPGYDNYHDYELISQSSIGNDQQRDIIYTMPTENERISPQWTHEDEYKSATLTSLLSVEKNILATNKNKIAVQKSGLKAEAIISAVSKTVDLNIIKQSLQARSQGKTDSHSVSDSSNFSTIDSVFTEAIHQFQIANYLNPAEHDGVIGQSTLETLGFINHGLKQKLNSSSFYGQTQLNRSDIKSQVLSLTKDFSAENWFQYILKPSWLGVKISDGVHLLLLRKLREAEAWLSAQPKYRGMTPAALGKALGFNADTRYSGARLSATKQAMHGFGLAIDINVSGNPWIGAGWIMNDPVLLKERYRMIDSLRNASGNKSLPGKTIFAYLDSIAQSAGTDTSKAYSILKQRNDEFISYIRTNKGELDYWKNSQTFGNRNPLNGFLNLHPDLVYALREKAGLAWGAIDFGPNASGDIMHFDMRTVGVGKFLCEKIGGFVPKNGHPVINSEMTSYESEYESEFEDSELIDESEYHEAIEEANWEENDNESDYQEVGEFENHIEFGQLELEAGWGTEAQLEHYETVEESSIPE